MRSTFLAGVSLMVWSSSAWAPALASGTAQVAPAKQAVSDRDRAPVNLADLERRVLEAARTRGADDAQTIGLVSQLANLYQDRGRFDDAEMLYLQALHASERLFGADNINTIIGLRNLATLYQRLGRYREADPLYVRALGISERALGRDAPRTLTALDDLSFLYQLQNRFDDAEPLLIRGVETSEREHGPEDPNTLRWLHNLALLYFRQGRAAEAEALFLRTLETRRLILGEDNAQTLGSVDSLAGVYASRGRLEEAERLYVQALRTSERLFGAEQAGTLNLASNLAVAYFRSGRYQDADPLFSRVLLVRDRVLGPDNPSTLVSIVNMARLRGRQGRRGEAEAYFTRALDVSGRLYGSAHPFTADVAAKLAELRLSDPRTAPSALGPAQLIVASLRARRSEMSDGANADAQRNREQAQRSNLFLLLPNAAWGVSLTDPRQRPALTQEAFTALQDGTAGSTGSAVNEMAVRHLAEQVGQGLTQLVQERETLTEQWAANGANYSAALAGSGSEAVTARRENLIAQRGRLEARITTIDAILRERFPQYFSLVRPEALDLQTAQAMLRPDEAILFVVPTESGTHVFGVSSTAVRWVRSDWATREVDNAVGELLRNVRTTLGGTAFTFNRSVARALYQEVVAPVEEILHGKRHVFVAASGSLSSIPFGILVTAPPQGGDGQPDALRATSWFADEHALVQIPSIQSLQLLRLNRTRTDARQPAGGSFVGFGNPRLEGPSNHPEQCSRGGGTPVEARTILSGRRTRTGALLADVGMIRQLCPLPGTASELENMRRAFHAPPTALFLAERSTEHAFRTMDLSQATIVALATHGLVAGELAGGSEPGLVFSPPGTATDEDDGFLTISEIAALRLNADWIILSACNTASGDGSAGAPGLSGLARAFFYAGARNLLASHWPVVDNAAERLTVRTIELMSLNSEVSRGQALQMAMREVRNDTGNAAWAHPAIWAPFVVIGDK